MGWGKGEPVGIMEGHTDGVDGAKLLKDGRILSWSKDGTLRLWDGESGEPVGIMEGHTAEVSGVEIITGWRYFLVLGWDYTIVEWGKRRTSWDYGRLTTECV